MKKKNLAYVFTTFFKYIFFVFFYEYVTFYRKLIEKHTI